MGKKQPKRDAAKTTSTPAPAQPTAWGHETPPNPFDTRPLLKSLPDRVREAGLTQFTSDIDVNSPRLHALAINNIAFATIWAVIEAKRDQENGGLSLEPRTVLDNCLLVLRVERDTVSRMIQPQFATIAHTAIQRRIDATKAACEEILKHKYSEMFDTPGVTGGKVRLGPWVQLMKVANEAQIDVGLLQSYTLADESGEGKEACIGADAAASLLFETYHTFQLFKQQAESNAADALESVKGTARKAIQTVDAAIEAIPRVDPTVREVGGKQRRAIEIAATAKPALVQLRAIAEAGSIAMPVEASMVVVWDAQYALRTGVFVSVNPESGADPVLTNQKPKSGKIGSTPRKLSLEARALVMLIDHPTWTVAEFAEELGCNPRSLYRLKRFTVARSTQIGKPPPSGSKSEYGIEARDDGDEDEY